MKKINLKGLDLVAYTETLSNGLDVIFVPFEKKANYFISYATRFGADVTSFTPGDEKKVSRFEYSPCTDDSVYDPSVKP